MSFSEFCLAFIAVMMVVLVTQVSGVASRLKERFPTEKEQERQWARNDPAGYSEAHKKQ